MVVTAFSVVDKANREKFFEETFLVANVSPKVVFGMLFLTLSGTNIDFLGWELWWRTYTTKQTLLTTKRVEQVGIKEFAAVALDLEHEIYLVYVVSFRSILLIASLGSISLNVHLSRRPHIFGLIAKKASTKVPTKYSDFADVFFSDLVFKLPEQIKINDHAIKRVDGQQPIYKPIYSLGPIELEILKAYIETNLSNGFIRPSKFPASVPILFEQKLDGFFWLCVNYQDPNNLMIKNQYLLPLIGESLNRLGKTRQFTQLNFTSAYHRMKIRKEDEWKTTFSIWYGHFEYQVILFNPTNIPANFWGYINKIFAKKIDIFVIVYLDDIFIYTNNGKNRHVIAVW